MDEDQKYWDELDGEMEESLCMKIATYDGELGAELKAKLENSLLDSELKSEQVKGKLSEEDALVMI